MTERKTASETAHAVAADGFAAKVSAAEVSALMDNELSRRECDAAVGGLAHDASLRATWQRYHLMRTALRHEPQYPVASGFAERVAARLAADTVPMPATRGLAGVRWRSGRAAVFARAYKGAAGLALAASVAAVAIVGVRTLTPTPGSPGSPGSAVPPQAALAPAPGATPAPIGVATAPQNSRRGIHWDTAQPEVENNLNAFLVQHSEFTRTSGMGVMSYVRIAGYDTNYDHSKE